MSCRWGVSNNIESLVFSLYLPTWWSREFMRWHESNFGYWYIWYDVFVNRSCVDTRWQQYSTHLHTNKTQNNTINLGSVRAVPLFASYTLVFASQVRKKHWKPSITVDRRTVWTYVTVCSGDMAGKRKEIVRNILVPWCNPTIRCNVVRACVKEPYKRI